MKDTKPMMAILFAGTVAVLAVSLLLNLASWALKDLNASDYVKLLGTLFFVALVLERALEVYVNAAHAPETEQLERELGKQRDALKFKRIERNDANTRTAEEIRWHTELLNHCVERQPQANGQTEEWCRQRIESLRKERDARFQQIDNEAKAPLAHCMLRTQT